MIFLTDGWTYLGPYDPETDPFGTVRATRWLRENKRASAVFVVRATTDLEARAAFRTGKRTA